MQFGTQYIPPALSLNNVLYNNPGHYLSRLNAQATNTPIHPYTYKLNKNILLPKSKANILFFYMLNQQTYKKKTSKQESP